MSFFGLETGVELLVVSASRFVEETDFFFFFFLFFLLLLSAAVAVLASVSSVSLVVKKN
jgi:hypothetical protein